MAEAAGRADRVKAFLKARGPAIAVEVLANFAGPYLIYTLAKKDLGEVGALIASSAPPIIWSLIEFARRRTVDAVSMLVLAGIVLSLLAFLGGGGPKFLLLREKLVTVSIGLAFVVSALIGRPLIYLLAQASMRRNNSDKLESFEAMKDNVHFKRTMWLMTMVWGLGLVAEAGVSAVLVFALPTATYLLVSPVLGYGTMGGLGLWTWSHTRRQRRTGDARRLAADGEARLSTEG